MKRLCLLLLPLVVAACSPSEPANPVAASVETISQAVSELSETAPLTTLPVAFQGRWDADLAACKRDSSDMRLTIEEKAFRFWESGGEVKTVTIATPDDITVQAAMSGEGEQWDKTLHMVLTDDGGTLTIDDGKTGVRVRCP